MRSRSVRAAWPFVLLGALACGRAAGEIPQGDATPATGASAAPEALSGTVTATEASGPQAASSATSTPSARPAIEGAGPLPTPELSERSSFAWEGAKCPYAGTEPHAVLVASHRPPERPARVWVAVERGVEAAAAAPEPEVEVRFGFANGSVAFARAQPIPVRDHDTRGYLVLAPSQPGATTIRVRVDGTVAACRPLGAPSGPSRWDGTTEAAYSLWVARLFSYASDRVHMALTPLLGDPTWNLLAGHLGLDEDRPSPLVAIAPDCADLPLALRAYFAWKLGLPFGVDRPWQASDDPYGEEQPTDAPTSGSMTSRPTSRRTYEVVVDPRTRLGANEFQLVWERLSRLVSSSDLRSLHDGDRGPLYPIAMTLDAIRPGSVYVDPHSHVSVVAGWTPTREGGRSLLLVDAQPSGMIALHPYFDGRLAYRRGGSAAGFHGFRPAIRSSTGELAPMTSAWLAKRASPARRPEPSERERTESSFFERLAMLEDPRPRDARAAYRVLYDALLAALDERAKLVDEATRAMDAAPEPIAFPPTRSLIFHGVGPWEALSTPCRDLRLLNMLRRLEGFPEAVDSHPERYRLEPGQTPTSRRADLEAMFRVWLDARALTYARSDGRSVPLTLGDVYARRLAFEVAYDPNDCPEHRWGAPEGSDERATCTRRAPSESRLAIERHRAWFREGYGCE